MVDHNLMKRMAPFLVLEILKKHTNPDEGGGINVTDVVCLLESEYGITMERKAVSRILDDLHAISEFSDYDPSWKLQMPFSIKHETRDRSTGNIKYDWRVWREYEDWELRLISDAILSIRSYHAEALLKKISKLGSKTYRNNLQYTRALDDTHISNMQFKQNVAALQEAIISGKKVTFRYADFGVDKQLHLRVDKTGKVRQYVVSPYQMAFRDGNYYLICNYNKYDDVAHYRVDRIRDIHILDESAKAYSAVSGTTGRNMNIRQYLDQHIHMYTGEVVAATFRIPETMVTDVLELFGENVDLSKTDDGNVTVRAEVSRTAMVRFAKTFAPEVKVLAPSNLVADVKKELEKALIAYSL